MGCDSYTLVQSGEVFGPESVEPQQHRAAHMTRLTALKTLVMLANLMNEYRDTWRPIDGDEIRRNPITPAYIL